MSKCKINGVVTSALIFIDTCTQALYRPWILGTPLRKDSNVFPAMSRPVLPFTQCLRQAFSLSLEEIGHTVLPLPERLRPGPGPSRRSSSLEHSA